MAELIIKGIRAAVAFKYQEIKKTKEPILKKKFISLVHRFIGLCYLGKDKMTKILLKKKTT